jgi:tripeptidyl-peptidase-1
MRFSVVVLAAALAATAAAVPFQTSHVLHERRSEAPKNWVKRSKISRNARLPMRIGMTQSNLDRGDELLMEV